MCREARCGASDTAAYKWPGVNGAVAIAAACTLEPAVAVDMHTPMITLLHSRHAEHLLCIGDDARSHPRPSSLSMGLCPQAQGPSDLSERRHVNYLVVASTSVRLEPTRHAARTVSRSSAFTFGQSRAEEIAMQAVEQQYNAPLLRIERLYS
jgi:hypothetical protein